MGTSDDAPRGRAFRALCDRPGRAIAESDAARSAGYYDRLSARYDVELTKEPTDLLARSAFQDIVARIVPEGSAILDFGCGTGLDATAYARRGYRVLAYDNSAGMSHQLEGRCSTEIAAGTIATYTTDYPSFFDLLPRLPRPQAVVADFAVLNMIRDLRPLFEVFAHHLAPPGWLIVSVVNPLHWPELLRHRWWRGFIEHQRGHTPHYLTEHFTSYLHFVPSILDAAPAFHLVGRANAGTFVRYDEPTRTWWWGETDSIARRVKRLVWRTPVSRLLGTFVFMVMRRDP
jgi:SAM-dependent methyltransferase